MKKGLWHRRIPNYFAFILLIVGIGVTSYLVQSGVIVVGQASPDKTPAGVLVSNVTHNSFTVTFTTASPSQTAVSVSQSGKNPQTFFDTRNKNGAQTPHYSHFITVSNLTPDTPYEFVILSDGESYSNNGKSYTARTGPILNTEAKNLGEIAGDAILPDGSASSDTVVEVEIEGGQILSTITDNNGRYKMVLNNVRAQNLRNYLNAPQNTEIIVYLKRGTFKTTIRSVLADATNLPIATLTYNYDFVSTAGDTVATSASVLIVPTPEVTFGEIGILTPAEGQSFIDSRPLFRGNAVPNQNVRIVIDQATTSVVANRNGQWSYRPINSLSQGLHKITIQTQDPFGITKSLSANFNIFPSGSTVQQTATPSATTFPTPTPTRAPTTQPLQQASPTPTTGVTPISNPTPTTSLPTTQPTPSPTIITLVSPSPTLFAAAPSNTPMPNRSVAVSPPPPGSASTIILATFSVILISAGAVLLFIL